MEITVAVNNIPNFNKWLTKQIGDSDIVISYFLKEKYNIILNGNYYEELNNPVVEYLTFKCEQQYTMFLLKM